MAATTALWLGGAGLAALVWPRRDQGALRAPIAAGALFAVLLVLLCWLGGPVPALPPWSRLGAAALGLGVLCAAASFGLALSIAMLITRTEPSALAVARRQLRRATAEQAAAARRSEADVQAAAIARRAWLSLVQAHAAASDGAAGLVSLAVVEADRLIGGPVRTRDPCPR